MTLAYILGSSLFGEVSTYDEPPVSRFDITGFDLNLSTGTYSNVRNFLKKNGREFSNEMVKHLPLIRDGIISGGNVLSCYELNNCLVANAIINHSNEVEHSLIVFGIEREKVKRILETLIYKTHFVEEYWEKHEERTLEVSENLRIEDLTRWLTE